MEYYVIREALEPCQQEDLKSVNGTFAAVMTSAEWDRLCADFNIEIDMELDTVDPKETKAVVNRESLTGSFCRPALTQNSAFQCGFSFVLNEKGIVLIDDSTYVKGLVEEIRRKKKSRFPSLERFLYDLLETAISGDLPMLERIEKDLNRIENDIMKGTITGYPLEMNDIRGDLLDLRVHYEQLIDLGQELEENENDFFSDDNLRYFHMFTERVIRLQTTVSGQREYVSQLRDLVQARLAEKQNTIMTVLTVITTIFLPLTLIAGWYGMNFVNMPELRWAYGYPAIIIVSVLIVVVFLWWFKKKKWM